MLTAKRITAIFLMGLSLCSISAAAAEAPSQAPVYTVGIVPQFEARKLHETWRPILDEVEKRTGLHFRIEGAPTIPAFEREFMAGKFDFAYLNPYHLLLAADGKGYLPLLRDVGNVLQGVLVVRADSGIDKVSDLNGKTIAFPSPNSLGASLQMRQELTDKFGIHFTPVYAKSHDSVYLHVLLREADAGGGVQKTLDQQKPEFRNLLRVIHRTAPVAPHPITAHPRVPEKVRLQVKEALLAIGATDEGKKLLAKVPISQIGLASMADYKPLRDMGLQRFYVPGD